jgi:hypothetical protein
MTDLEQAINREERDSWRRYWESPTGVANAPAGMVELARLHINKLCDALDGLAALPPAPAQGITREKLDALIRKLGIAPDEAGWYGVIELRDAILATTGEPEPRKYEMLRGSFSLGEDVGGEPEPVHDESWEGEKSRQPSISLRDLLLFRLRHPTSPGDE